MIIQQIKEELDEYRKTSKAYEEASDIPTIRRKHAQWLASMTKLESNAIQKLTALVNRIDELEKPEAICIWPFYAAPIEFRQLSTHGGDEDWIIYIPAFFGRLPEAFDYATEDINRVYENGWGYADYHTLDNKAVVIIFAHA